MHLCPPPLLLTADWIEQNVRLPSENSDTPGDFDFYYVPHMLGVCAAFDSNDVTDVYCMKSAQVGWTTILIGYLLSRIAQSPTAMMGMFSAEKAAREFSIEKLKSYVEGCAALDGKMDVSTTRQTGNGVLNRSFPGGFMKLIGSNAVRSAKSTPAPLLFVEEPDDAAENMQGQGDSVYILYNRAKGFRWKKKILGGTPSVDGFSRVQDWMKMSDMCVLPVTCHECDESHVLDFANASWLQKGDDEEAHEIYGRAAPETAVYSCPFCGSAWNDNRRKSNIRDTVFKARAEGDEFCGWVQTRKTNGKVKGFSGLSELYNCLNSSTLEDVVAKSLEAEYYASRGDETKRMSFVNNQLGLPYKFDDGREDADYFRDAAKADPESQRDEFVCPKDGLLLTFGVDVQHDRLAAGGRAWGKEDRSWSIHWGEIAATSTTIDKKDGVWDALDSLVFRAFPHEDGGTITASAISIDSSDGSTSDAVYEWVRSRQKRYPHIIIMAVKGSSSQTDPEIFTQPSVVSIDHKRHDKKTKAQRRGIKVFMVGTNKAKDWIAAHMGLDSFSGGYHYYKLDQMRWDYFDQMTGEAKIPHKTIRNRRVWTQKNGQAVEAWDCEVYALHAARAKRVHLMKDQDWSALRRTSTAKPTEKKTPRPANRGGFTDNSEPWI